MKTLLILVLACMVQSTGLSFSLFGPSKPLTPEEKIEQLKQQQVDNPLDPEINYNLGVASYKGGKFEDAYTNFTRACEHVGKNELLEKQCLFNAGSASFKHAMSALPRDWEHQETVDQGALEQAITSVKQSIEHYKKFLNKEPKSQKGDANVHYTEKLLKKLEEKLKKQQQQKQDQKKQQENKDQQKQQQDQQQQQKDKDSQDQKKQSDQKQSDDQQQSAPKEQKEHDKKEGAQKDNGDDRKDAAKKPQERPADREDDKFEHKKDEQKEQNVANHSTPQEQESGKQSSTAENKQGGAEKQEKEPEGVEMRGLRALLENLQSSEADAQKRLLLRKVAESKDQPQQGQKPW